MTLNSSFVEPRVKTRTWGQGRQVDGSKQRKSGRWDRLPPANRNAKPIQNRRADLLDDECSHFRRGINYGFECVRTPRQRPHLDSRRGRSEPYSSRAYRVVDRTASASTLRSVAH